MANPSSDRNETIIRSILFIAVVLLAVGIIIFLKRSSDVPLTPEGFAARDSAQRMATPDTTVAPTEDFPSSDTNTAQPTDTVSMDLRLPSDAGYEDGYFAVKVPINGTLRVSRFGVETKVLKVRSLLKLKKKIVELEMNRCIVGEIAAPNSERISDLDSPTSHVEKNK